MTETPHFIMRLTAADRAALERIAAEVVPDDALPTHAPRMFSRVATMVRMVARGLLVVVPPALLAEVERLRAVAVEEQEKAKEAQP
jgi:hypothetical protein